LFNLNNIRIELKKEEIVIYAPLKKPLTHWIAQKGEKEFSISIKNCIILNEENKIIEYIKSKIDPIKYRSKKIKKILNEVF